MPMPPTARRRRIAPLLCLAALAAAGGCRSSNRPDYAPAANAPADYDEAMALRDYPRTPGYYANGDTRAGPTEFPFEYAAPLPGEPNYARRRYVAVAADPLIFVANLALLPATLFAHPPTEQRTYQGSIVEPSYTAAVPLPPTPEQLAAMATPPQTGPLRPVTPAGGPKACRGLAGDAAGGRGDDVPGGGRAGRPAAGGVRRRVRHARPHRSDVAERRVTMPPCPAAVDAPHRIG